MPKISTDNYDTVANWNGSQDLFVVEQSDGTKVATPAMVKQFMEAGDFEATGEIIDGHGNILADMAKADEAKGIAEAGDFEATGEIKDGHGNILNDVKGGVVIKRFFINTGNTSLDTGINVNQTWTTGFAAVVSTHGSYNAGVASVYIGGVAYRRQDGTVGDINYTRLGGVGIGGSSDTENMEFSVVNDKLQLRTKQYQAGASITLILSRR